MDVTCVFGELRIWTLARTMASRVFILVSVQEVRRTSDNSAFIHFVFMFSNFPLQSAQVGRKDVGRQRSRRCDKDAKNAAVDGDGPDGNECMI